MTPLSFALQISINMQEMAETNKKVKEAQKEQYFLGLERERKEKLLHRLAEDLKEEKRRKALEAKIAAEIKSGGLLLPSLSLSVSVSVSGGATATASGKSLCARQTESLASPVAASQPTDSGGDAPASGPVYETEDVPPLEQPTADFGAPAPRTEEVVVFPIEFDVYDMSQEDGTVDLQPAQATAADRRRMKRAAAASAAAETSHVASTFDGDSSPASAASAAAAAALPLLEEALREGLDSASAVRRLSVGHPQLFTAAAAVATALRAGLSSAERTLRDSWRGTSSTSRAGRSGMEEGEEGVTAPASTNEEEAVSNMMTRMAFDFLVQRGNDRSTVTLAGLLHMDLINDLLERGFLTHHALQGMYRQVGGGTGFSGLTLPQFESFLDLLAPVAEKIPVDNNDSND